MDLYLLEIIQITIEIISNQDSKPATFANLDRTSGLVQNLVQNRIFFWLDIESENELKIMI